MTTPQRPQNSFSDRPASSANPERPERPGRPEHSERPERTNPEMHSDRDALNMVRKRRSGGGSSGGSSGKFHLTMPLKIGAVALIFAGVVLSVWMMKSTQTPLNDDDLPVLSADIDMDDFKVAPSEEDEVRVPHSDKEFYSELDSAGSKTKDAFRKAPERPSEQVSQEALFAKGSSAATEEASTETTKEASGVPVKVIENANNAAKKAYKAPAPTVSTSKPQKTLEMAIQETQKEMKKEAHHLSQDKMLSKKVSSAKQTGSRKASVTPGAKVGTSKGYWVQVASLPTQKAAQTEALRLQAKSAKELKTQKYRTVRVDLGKPTGIRYRVHFGPFPKKQAVQKCQNLKGNEKISCLVVKG